MFSQTIEFSAHPDILSLKDVLPEPANKNIPQWYKDVENPTSHLTRTIKACKPFLDSICAGYILKNVREQEINFNKKNLKGHKETWVEVSKQATNYGAYNLNEGNETHPIDQVGGLSCPYVQTNKGYNLYKIRQPWIIKVPKGYGLLFLPPINRPEKRFEILSGIVDGNYSLQTNFPCIFKKEGSWTLERGAPIATVFPFKLEHWKMKITKAPVSSFAQGQLDNGNYLTKWYEKTFWTKKSWK